MNIVTSRRKFLTTGGGTIAASAFARAGLLAAEPEKEKEGDEEVSPAEDLMREDGFEKMVDKVAGIEKKLGIYDLAQFTPKV